MPHWHAETAIGQLTRVGECINEFRRAGAASSMSPNLHAVLQASSWLPQKIIKFTSPARSYLANPASVGMSLVLELVLLSMLMCGLHYVTLIN